MAKEIRLMRLLRVAVEGSLKSLSMKELEILRDRYPHMAERITKEIEKRQMR